MPVPMTPERAHDRAARRVLYISSVPPPAGGVSSWTRILLDRGLPGGFVPALVEKSIPAEGRVQELVSVSGATLRRFLRVLGALLRELALRRPALVHINVNPLGLGPYGDLLCAVAARISGVPIVTHYHGLISRLGTPLAPGLLVRVLTRLVRMSRFSIALNEPSRNFILELARGSRCQVVSIPNFYDEGAMAPHEVRARDAGARPQVVFVARLTIAKGCPEVVGAARAMPAVDFHLLGSRDPETEPHLRDLPDNVTVHGEVDLATVMRKLAASDVFLLPSAQEGFPYGVLEAMVLGLPVVATQVGAIPEMVIQGQGGVLVDERSDSNLVSALEEVLADESRRVAMGRFNQARARREYAYSAVAPRLAELYSQLV